VKKPSKAEQKRLTKKFESFQPRLYLCSAGKLTGGWGHHFAAGSLIPTQVCETLFKGDWLEAEHNYDSLNLVLPPVRRYVVVDMLFNLGLPKLRLFRRFLQALRDHDYEWAAAEMEDSKWFYQVGHRAKVLKWMMLTGEWHDPYDSEQQYLGYPKGKLILPE
jgi:lysozyme